MSAREEALDAATQHAAAACNCDMVTARLQMRTVINALRAAGYAVVPREASVEMLQDGRDAYRATHMGGLSGMTIEAQTRAQCCREAACYAAMIAVGEAGE